MTSAGATGLRSRNVVLAAMIFAVAMTFIDQTIVSIAAPNIQRELGLTNTGVQWAINAYLLALAALFAFGGRLADTVGHRRMVDHRCDRLCRRLGHVRSDAEGRGCADLDRGLSGPAGRGRRHHVPCRSRHRGPDLSSAPAWPGPGVVLRHCRRPHRGGTGAGRLPDRVDLAGDLLGQHTGGPHRPGVDHGLPPRDRVSLGPDRLPRSGPDRRRGVALDRRLPAVRHLGVERSLDRGVHRGRRRPARGLRPGGAAHRLTADAGADLPGQGLRRREPGARDQHAGVRPVVLLCQRICPDRPGQVGTAGRALSALLLPRVCGDVADRRAHP